MPGKNNGTSQDYLVNDFFNVTVRFKELDTSVQVVDVLLFFDVVLEVRTDSYYKPNCLAHL